MSILVSIVSIYIIGAVGYALYLSFRKENNPIPRGVAWPLSLYEWTKFK